MSFRSLEEALSRLPGVEAVRVVGNGIPREVHILAAPGKPAKQVVRDVQSVALAAFGMTIDRRVVSVVQIASTDMPQSDRPAIADITHSVEGPKLKIVVTLTWQDHQYIGEASGPAATATRLPLVGEATLRAVEQAVDQRAALAVSAVDTPFVGNRQVAIAQVVLYTEGEERLLVGSALVSGDPDRAMARAVLDALNRQVPELRR